MLECVYINNLVCSCVLYVSYRVCVCVCVCGCVRIFLLTLLHLVNVHATLLIIPLHTAVRAPAEAVGLKLDLFHLKDQICPETHTSKVTSHKLLGNLCYKCSAVEIYEYQGGKERTGEDFCMHILQNFKDSTLILNIFGQQIVG